MQIAKIIAKPNNKFSDAGIQDVSTSNFKTFTSRGALLYHTRFVHNMKNTCMCGHCNQAFGSLSLLKSHFKNDHKKNIQETLTKE